MTAGLLIITAFTAAFCMLAKRMSRTMITAPMIFLALGWVLSETGLFPQAEMRETLHLVAEVALIVVLFLDAAQIDLRVLRVRHVWPVRMLAIGLPLMIVIGTLAAFPFLPPWPLAAVALVAAILAPTDAALGQVVVTNPIVPVRVRRALTVESGLNDGLALPAILLFASIAAEAIDAGQTNWFLFGAKQLVLGPLIGIVFGSVGGRVLLFAKDRNLTSNSFEGVGALALAGAAYLGATEIGGNGFIAAFVAGLFFGNVVKGRCAFIYEFTESEGQLLTWAAFLLLGLVLVPDAITHLTLDSLAIILLSLFVVRPLAIWLSLIGTDASSTTRLFFGWFGPRGLATALFSLLIVEQIAPEIGDQILGLAVNAVWISAVLHGLSAAPAARWYGARMAKMDSRPEMMAIHASAKPLATRWNDGSESESERR
ncbi:cation:proton antiporter [Bauldia sp.]|uniref:cation:proton antiporter n=1 Tax=Bauldia sp. TaxID=2575872 RepID=UPI003BA8E635